MAALPRDLPRRQDDRVHLQGRHLPRPGRRRHRRPPDAQRRPRLHAGLEPRRQADRVCERPVRQLRRLHHAGRGGRGAPADVPLGAGIPLRVHARRQVHPVRGRPDGHRRQPDVPHRLAARALPGAGRRRPRRAGADHARRGCQGEPQRPVPALPGQEGRRERLAQAPHLVDHARHLDRRHQDRHPPEGHHLRRRGSQPGLHRQRPGLLLPQRGERLVQRAEDEPAGRQRAGRHLVQEGAGAVPEPLRRRDALLRLRRPDLHDEAGRPAAEGRRGHRHRRAGQQRAGRAGDRRRARARRVADRQGGRVRLPRRGLRLRRRRQRHQADHRARPSRSGA